MNFHQLFMLSVLSVSVLFAQPGEEKNVTLDRKIASLIVLGFHGTAITPKGTIARDIEKGLGGVILFDQDPLNKMQRKNIINAKQLRTLNADLQSISEEKLLICVDEEGGKVARLKAKDGFETFPAAEDVAKGNVKKAQGYYGAMARMLSDNGINTNFAPSVDLLFDYNPIIAGKKRAFSSDPKVVSRYASIFVEEHRKNRVLTVIKHFPGHGSSKADSHKGFTDVTNTWSDKELEPFMQMIEAQKVDMIMTAHIFNRNLDEKYPATLSNEVNTGLLRSKMHYEGVIITDDLQMAAIHKHYTLEDTVTLALNSGVDILLFANQLAEPLGLDAIVKVVKAQVRTGKISEERIEEAYGRVKKLKERL
ncbi:glycoside hydrolase family 3 N-terminal domain-containing protein [Sulfurimonas sp. HSL3-7]|uniref:glycoside hydrolase family 3 protein n=1 Tax=Sulfonitrofixus jiaomeiensis TaxID=3131938 RepID=UPI0031F7AB9C